MIVMDILLNCHLRGTEKEGANTSFVLYIHQLNEVVFDKMPDHIYHLEMMFRVLFGLEIMEKNLISHFQSQF